MSPFMSSMFAEPLIEMPPVSKTDTFADKGDRSVAAFARHSSA